MDIYEVLKADHDKLKPLLNKLVQATEANQETTRILSQIRDELVPHSRAEEAVFYNSLREIDAAKGEVQHSYTEHMEAETLLRTLQGLNKINADWTKAAQKLKDALEHHIEEEEGRVFSAAKKVLLDEEARQMSDAFQRLKPEIQEQGFMQNTLDMIANMMPKRFAGPLRSMNKQS